jgi:hypothetical protein
VWVYSRQRAVDLFAQFILRGDTPKNNKKTEERRKSRLSYELYRPRRIYIYINVYVCVCVCVRARKGDDDTLFTVAS